MTYDNDRYVYWPKSKRLLQTSHIAHVSDTSRDSDVTDSSRGRIASCHLAVKPRCRNRRHKSTPFFWCLFLVCVSCKSLTGFFWYQIPTPIRTLFYSKPECGVHVTEMMTCDWSMIIMLTFSCVVKLLYAVSSFVYLFCLFTAPKNFIPDAHGTKRRGKMKSIHDTGFWSVCHGPKSAQCK